MQYRVPDAKTIWLFRDTLTKADVIRDLFDIFTGQRRYALFVFPPLTFCPKCAKLSITKGCDEDTPSR